MNPAAPPVDCGRDESAGALLGDLATFDIAGYRLETAIIFGPSDLIAWALAGLAIAGWLRPPPLVETRA